MSHVRVANVLAISVAAFVVLTAALLLTDRPSGAAGPDPSRADTARLLGYLWADGAKTDGVWDVNGPSGTSTLIEHLVLEHGGTLVDRARLKFRLPEPYDWPEWTDGLPDDDARVVQAVQNPHFLAAVVEAEASTFGVIYDQGGNEPDYTIGRLEGLQQLLTDRGLGTARVKPFNVPGRGQVELGEADYRRLRGSHRFVCPLDGDAIRLPGGEDYDTHGNIQWFTEANRWAGLVRNDCRPGVDVSPVVAPVGTCAVRVEDGEVVVDWTFERGSVSIRRDRSFVESVSALDSSWSDRAVPGTFAYDVRVFFNGTQVDAACGTVIVEGGDQIDEPPAGTCLASADGDGVELRWADFGARSYAVRRNAKWVTTVTERSRTVAGSLADVFEIRYRSDGQATDVLCTVDGGGVDDGGNDPGDEVDAVPCAVSATAGGVRLDFARIEGVSQRVIRLNGRWLATTNGVATFVTNAGDVDDTWVIRHRTAGQVFDISCE